MLRLLSDENVNGAIIRGLRLREPSLDLVRAQDVGLRQTPDPVILQWAAENGRIVITGDLNTMVGDALARVRHGEPMVGVLALREDIAIGKAIEEILMIAQACSADEINLQVWFIPIS
jgi:predicted nuclease of predicted toxin-antitoxin system